MASKKRRKGYLFGRPKSQIVKHPGSLTAAAKRSGKSISGLCASGKAHHGKLAKKCALAKAFRTMRGKKRSKGRSRR